MKKFTELNNINKTVESSDNKQDFIKNLIEETLSIENNEIKGKDVLYTAFETILNMNEAKTKVGVLESVKTNSMKHLNMMWINESIETEKKKLSNPELFKKVEEVKQVEIVNENIEEVKDDIITEEVNDKIVFVDGNDAAQHSNKPSATVEEDYNAIMGRFSNRVSVSEDKFATEMEGLTELFNQINKNKFVNEEHHLQTREEKVSYILDHLFEERATVIKFVAKLPNYVKDADLQDTIDQLSDSEVDALYKEIEK